MIYFYSTVSKYLKKILILTQIILAKGIFPVLNQTTKSLQLLQCILCMVIYILSLLPLSYDKSAWNAL